MYDTAILWGIMPFVFSAFAMGVVSIQRIKRLQERIDELEGR